MKYPALFAISFIIRAFGYVFMVLGIVGSIVASLATVETVNEFVRVNQTFMGITGIIISVVVGLIFIAFGEIIKVLIDIEQNTRR
jgi:cell division protein FtsX